ncbi:VWA domain-containing protein (plasmid) [Lysinibacillus capsici]|uniref:vWA domain-containing protein n=1 Tax=Lysinibacillus capsici TaxID=2115968 RepID=UPI0021D95731|nr:VWA domain-containing protein [Lysinibacillus capsici]UYB50065.1 VWA domain-containing protein [Lysinibacillus capsici]
MEKNQLMRMEDLLDNPTPRIPICLCLDTSSSMLRVVGGKTVNTGKTVFQDGQNWNIVEGGITALQELQDGVNHFYNAISEDEVARFGAEICVVTFDSGVRTLADYATIDVQPEPPDLDADGMTQLGEGVNLALDLLDERKNEYKDAGVDYYQPWLVLMTDGEPNGDDYELQRAIKRATDLVNQRKLTVFPIGIGTEADMNVLAKFSPARPPLRLKGTNFKEFFEWLSQSVSTVSQSMPGDKIQLNVEGIKAWGEI